MDSAPQATVAVARSIYSHLPPDDTPLWLGFKKVDNADPAAVLAVLASMTVDPEHPGPAVPGHPTRD